MLCNYRLPAGVLILGLQNLGGETMRDKRRRERRELHELRVTEWFVLLEDIFDVIVLLNTQMR